MTAQGRCWWAVPLGLLVLLVLMIYLQSMSGAATAGVSFVSVQEEMVNSHGLLVTCSDSLCTWRWLPFPVLTRLIVEQLYVCDDLSCSWLVITMKYLMCGSGAAMIRRWSLQQTVRCWRYLTVVLGHARQYRGTRTALLQLTHMIRAAPSYLPVVQRFVYNVVTRSTQIDSRVSVACAVS